LLRNPKILLFDEATSALDNATQSKVLDSLKRRNITVINVAHRLDAALRSEQVIVMDHGSVVEKGSPNQLIAQKGLFFDLVQNDKRQSAFLENKS
jgi:ATP-binding cassette subfamily B protein